MPQPKQQTTLPGRAVGDLLANFDQLSGVSIMFRSVSTGEQYMLTLYGQNGNWSADHKNNDQPNFQYISVSDVPDDLEFVGEVA